MRLRPAIHAVIPVILASIPATVSATQPDGDYTEAIAGRGPVVVYLQTGVGAPTGIYGLSVGYEFAPSWAIETGFGLGLTGLQIPVMARWYTPILDDIGPPGESLSAFSVGFGPSIGLISKSLGLNVPHDENKDVDEDALYAVAWLNVEFAWETRASWGGSFRVAIGGGPRIFDTMSDLCSPATKDANGNIPVTDCDPPHFTSGPRVANAPFIAYLNIGFGWEFGR